jgi:Spy/CpxP family protein refolding chaperone
MAVVFLCGGVVGAFSHRLYTVSGVSANANPRNPEEFRKRFLADMKTRLKLTDDQVTGLEAIMENTRMRFRATRDSIEPEMKKIREDQQLKISELLSPEQDKEWEKIVEERQRNRQSKKRGGPAVP